MGHLHDRAGALASLLYTAEKLAICLSNHHVDISAMSALIKVGLVQNESCVYVTIKYILKVFKCKHSSYKCTKGMVVILKLVKTAINCNRFLFTL